MVYNIFIGSTSGTALGTTYPNVDAYGNLNISGIAPIKVKRINSGLLGGAITPSNTATDGVVTLDPGTPALNTDYSFSITQPLFTLPGSNTNLNPRPTAPQSFSYNTGAYTSAPTATQVCNDIRAILKACGSLDVVLTGSSTVILTGSTNNSIITRFKVAG